MANYDEVVKTLEACRKSMFVAILNVQSQDVQMHEYLTNFELGWLLNQIASRKRAEESRNAERTTYTVPN